MVEQMVGHLKLILNSADNYTVQAESTTFQMAYHKETSLSETGGLQAGDLPDWKLQDRKL